MVTCGGADWNRGPTSPIMEVLTGNVMVAQEPACWNRLLRRTTTTDARMVARIYSLLGAHQCISAT